MNDTAKIGFLILRLTVGIALIAHSAYLKVFVFTMSGTEKFFASLGLPAAMAWAVLVTEIVTGALIIKGFKTRFAAAAAIPVLIGATLAHFPSGWLFSNSGGGWEYPLFWTCALISLVMLDDGTIKSKAASTAST